MKSNRSNSMNSFGKVLLAHERRYPLWQIQDLYKLAHQAALGSEHAVISPEFARRALEEEIQSISPGDDEPLVDPISEDGEIVRIHLRPFLNAGLSVTRLLDAFLLTSVNFKGSSKLLQYYFVLAKKLMKDNQISLFATDLDLLEAVMQEKGFPALHHSEVFKNAYYPAYRVVARKYLGLTEIFIP